jgi:hypothetical protein
VTGDCSQWQLFNPELGTKKTRSESREAKSLLLLLLPNPRNENAALVDVPTCGTCGKKGHTSSNCWKNATCDICKQKGHGEIPNASCQVSTTKKVSVEKHFKDKVKNPKP